MPYFQDYKKTLFQQMKIRTSDELVQKVNTKQAELNCAGTLGLENEGIKVHIQDGFLAKF